MYRANKIGNRHNKRTLRVVYGQTQAYPYAASLHSSFRGTDGSLLIDGTSSDPTTIAGSANPTRGANAFKYQNGLLAGMVVTLVPGTEQIKIAAGNAAQAGEQPFGLLANNVGGTLDEVGDYDEIGVWRSGQGGVFEVLAPAFGTISLTATNAGATTPLYAGTDGRLTTTAPSGSPVAVANLLQVVGTTRILIDLKV